MTVVRLHQLPQTSRPTGWVAWELYKPIAHKGTIGNPPRGPGGPRGFLDLGEIPVKPLPGRGWGEMATPKGFLGGVETIPLAKNPGETSWGTNPSTKSCFPGPHFGPKKVPQAFGDPDPDLGLQKWGPGSKTMQNPLVNAPNGAICCKLWPQTM